MKYNIVYVCQSLNTLSEKKTNLNHTCNSESFLLFNEAGKDGVLLFHQEGADGSIFDLVKFCKKSQVEENHLHQSYKQDYPKNISFC